MQTGILPDRGFLLLIVPSYFRYLKMVKSKSVVLWKIGIVLFIALGASSAATINFPKAGTALYLTIVYYSL